MPDHSDEERRLREHKRELVRDANTEIEAVAHQFNIASDDAGLHFLCECGQPDCNEIVSIDLTSFELIRADGYFVLAPGHKVTRAERACRTARATREEARALQAQAKLQRMRARRSRDEGSPDAGQPSAHAAREPGN